jgi:hypothetical protein
MPLKWVKVNPDAAVASLNQPTGTSDVVPTGSTAKVNASATIGKRIFMLRFGRFPV